MNTHLNLFTAASTADELDDMYRETVDEASLFAEAGGVPLVKVMANIEHAYQVRLAQLRPRTLIRV